MLYRGIEWLFDNAILSLVMLHIVTDYMYQNIHHSPQISVVMNVLVVTVNDVFTRSIRFGNIFSFIPQVAPTMLLNAM